MEDLGGGELLARDLDLALARDGEEAKTALEAEGILRAAPLARTWPCDGVGCAKRVTELRLPGKEKATSKKRRFLAVCSRDPAECELEEVAEGELAQRTIVLAAVLSAVCRALGIEPSRASRGSAGATRAGEPILLGEALDGESARDVFFVRRPGAPELRDLAAERANVERRTWILVPSARALPTDVVARAGAIGNVEIEALTDLVTVDGARLSAVPRMRIVRRRGEPANRSQREGGRAASDAERPKLEPRGAVRELLPAARRWSEVSFYNAEQHDKIGVEIGPKHVELTAADLGLAEKSGRRRPITAFQLLVTICDGNGVFGTKKFGSRDYGKRLMSDLRIALTGAFGIDDDPFEKYSYGTKCWKPKFRAFAASRAEVREMEAEMGEIRPAGAAKRRGRTGKHSRDE